MSIYHCQHCQRIKDNDAEICHVREGDRWDDNICDTCWTDNACQECEEWVDGEFDPEGRCDACISAKPHHVFRCVYCKSEKQLKDMDGVTEKCGCGGHMVNTED